MELYALGYRARLIRVWQAGTSQVARKCQSAEQGVT
jgi:hypothetical protein